MSFVLDASAALAWAFERQDPQEAKAASAWLSRLSSDQALVPELWHSEVVNALLVALRRSVIEPARASDFFARLEGLPIVTDPVSLNGRKQILLATARAHGLSAYDAGYLDLAIRTGSPLATFDRALAGARDAAGIPAP